MTNDEREQNQVRYLADMRRALDGLMERCGNSVTDGDVDDAVVQELADHQRGLFVLSGTVGLLSIAIADENVDTIWLYDWLMGYYVNKDLMSQEERNRFIVKILTAFEEQVTRDHIVHHSSKDDHANNRFAYFVNILKMAILVIDGTMSEDEMTAVGEFCLPIIVRCLERKNVERN